MSEWRTFRSELSAPRSDVLVMLTTFTLTVVVDLTLAIQVGMVLAAFLFMRRMSEVTSVAAVTLEFAGGPGEAPEQPYGELAGVAVYEIDGPFFGAAEKFKETMGTIANPPTVLILRMRNVVAIDSTAMHALRDLVRRTRRDGTRVMVAEARARPMVAFGRSDVLDLLGEENLFGTVEEALDEARADLGRLRAGLSK